MALKLLKKVDDYIMKSVTDFKGNKFKSISSMCKYYNINTSTYMGRISRGWSNYKALTTILLSPNKPVKDHLGNEFNSVKAMCKYYNIDYKLYNQRLHKGWSLERALTKNEDLRQHNCRDYNGKVYNSMIDMCKSYNIPYNVYKYRITHNWNLKDALTMPISSSNHCIIDDKLSEQLKIHLDVKSKEFQNRKYLIVTFYDTNGKRHMVICDYLGNVFTSQAAMFRYYDVTRSYFYHKLVKYGIKNALTPNIVKDHLGNKFNSKSEMYRHYNIKKQTAEFRLQRGWSLKDILTTPVRQRK